MRYRKLFIEIIVGLFVLLWIYAAVSKLAEFETFKYQLGKSPFVTNMVGFVAWFIPLSELLIDGLLIWNSTRLLGLYLSFFLMLLFTGYIYAMLNFSYYIPCSCGGILSAMSWEQHLLFNIVFTILGLTAILLYGGNHSGGSIKSFFAQKNRVSRKPV